MRFQHKGIGFQEEEEEEEEETLHKFQSVKGKIFSSFEDRVLRAPRSEPGLVDLEVSAELEIFSSGELLASCLNSSEAEDTEVLDPCVLIGPSGGMLGW